MPQNSRPVTESRTLQCSGRHSQIGQALKKSNITKEEETAINSLKRDKTIIILPSDKGRTTVIRDTEAYEKQMENLLGNRDTNEILKERPHRRKEKDTENTVKTTAREQKNYEGRTGPSHSHRYMGHQR